MTLNEASVMSTLEMIDIELAARAGRFERAADGWFRQRRERERKHAEMFLAATGTVAERSERAKLESALEGVEAEASFESQRAAIKVLEARANIGLGLLKAMGRGA